MEIRKDLEMHENKTQQNLWDAADVVLRRKFIGVNAYIKKKIPGVPIVAQWVNESDQER